MSVLKMGKKSRVILVLCFGWILGCVALQGQVNDQGRVNNRTNDHSAVQPVYTQRSRTPEASELAKENYSRVAASTAQIRAVLVRDAGLLVELKRWVAKEATDNGQIVEDQDLTDQAIFDRLDRDRDGLAVEALLVNLVDPADLVPHQDAQLAFRQ